MFKILKGGILLKKNNFKTNLKCNISNKNNIFNSNFDKNSILSELDLLNVPETLQVNISDDNKYLNIRLVGTSDDSSNHLLFQLPLNENKLSCLKNHPDYQDLLNRYQMYTKEYIDENKKYALQENEYLKEKFPGLVFTIKIRIKSFESYITKLDHNIANGKSPYINDIIAERIIISQYKNCRSEKVLKKVCYDVAKALYDFRINTNFRMKKDVNSNPSNSNEEYITRDYIKYPKDNGYQSLHIQMESKYNNDLDYETQIRTLYMESQSKSSNEIAHNLYKPRLLNDTSALRVPSYSVIPSFKDPISGKFEVYDIPFEDRFYHYYNTSLNNHGLNSSKRTIPITYKTFKEELHQIENSLGYSFKDLRSKIRHCPLLASHKTQEQTEAYCL